MIKFYKAHQDKFILGIIIALFLGFCFILLYRLGVHAFIDWDESIYGQIAKESFQNHHFLNFFYFGKAWYEKPPLGIWLISIAYAIGGVNEWTARIPSALAAIGTVALSLRWVWEIRKSHFAVIFTMAGFYIMFPFITAAYFVNLDTIVGFFVLGALYSWWKSKNNHNWYFVFGLAIGLGVMTKSVVGLFPIIPIVIYQILSWDFSFLRAKKYWYGIILSLIIILPWHAYMSLTVGYPFWDNYFVYHVLERYSTSLETNGEPFNYYAQIIFLNYPITLAIFAGSFVTILWQTIKNLNIRYIVISALALFIIFSTATTKLPSYISVVEPLLVMIIGIGLADLINFVPKHWLKFIITTVLILSFIYTGVVFNSYKLTVGEDSIEYINNRSVGLFLKDYHPELPVYINDINYKNLAIGFYANRAITPNPNKELITPQLHLVYKTITESVYETANYLIIVR